MAESRTLIDPLIGGGLNGGVHSGPFALQAGRNDTASHSLEVAKKLIVASKRKMLSRCNKIPRYFDEICILFNIELLLGQRDCPAADLRKLSLLASNWLSQRRPAFDGF